MAFVYPTAQLLQAASAWDEQSDIISSAEKNLRQTQVAALGSRVSGPAQALVTNWAAELSALRDDAVSYSQTLADARVAMILTDSAVSDGLGTLLPWGDGTSR